MMDLPLTDFHSHLVPGVDDGSETLEQSLGALEKMWRQGVRCVITTPHFQASTLNRAADFESRMKGIDHAWRGFHAAAAEAYPGLRLERGVEMALDEPIASAPDERVRLARTQFMLVEFPWFTIPPNSGQALMQLRHLGVIPVVAHPERYENLADNWRVLDEWKRCGAFLQVNAGSLVGAYGGRIEAKGWKVLEAGLADYISSDYHARGEPSISDVRDRMAARGGESQFRMLTHLNGEKLLNRMPPAPIERLRRPDPKWRRLKTLLRRPK